MQIALDLSGMPTVPPDSALLVAADNVARVLFGIDVCETDLRRAEAEGYDLVIAHHPFGQWRIIGMLGRHNDLMLQAGVPAGAAMEACQRNMEPYTRRAAELPLDDDTERLAAMARDLGIGLMNIHGPCDELGRIELQRLADELVDTASVSDLVSAYRAIPEIAASDEDVELVCGSIDSCVGRTVVIHGAGTNGGYPVATALFDAGVNTVVYIHLRSQEQKSQLAQESKGNLILTGHYGSDSRGINPFLDVLENEGIEVVCFANMIRIKR
ncbi:Nif3-like dinuclear metal center hexameric protein [Verrucomicrobiota bacterium]